MKLTLEDIRKQKSPNYQHFQGTCACSSCMCGQCKCQITSNHIGDLTNNRFSNYQREFKWKKIIKVKPLYPIEYQSNTDKILLKSTYQQQFQNKPIQVRDHIKRYQNESLTFDYPQDFQTSYGRAFSEQKPSETICMRPIEVRRMVNLPQRSSSTYKKDFKERTQSLENDQSLRYPKSKIKIASGPNLFMETSYQHSYQQQNPNTSQLWPPVKNQTFMPTFEKQHDSQYKIEFRGKKINKCQARQMIESFIL